MAGSVLAWVPGGAGVASAAGATFYVAPNGSASNADTSCSTAGYSTISSAVAAASSGDTVDVCPGTYDDTVSLSTKAVTINGNNGGAAILDAVNQFHGIVVSGAATAGTVIENLTIENAKRSGVYLGGTSTITLSADTVTGNDQMCQPQTTQDDCGESVEVEGLTNSTITGNTITKGAGGILFSDGIPAGSTGQQAFGATTPTSGPTTGNTVSNNTVTDNIWDCGITMAAHNSNGVTQAGPNPTGGGIFANTIENNVVTGNGTSGGGGSGIILAGPFPGTGVYNNTIQGNTVSGNGEPGITLHSHAPGEDFNGNKILDNTVGVNAVGQKNPGVGIFSTASSQGDAGSAIPVTTGIEIFSAYTALQGTVIQGNKITGNHYGVWVYNAATGGISGNTTSNTTVPEYITPLIDTGYYLVTDNGTVARYGAVRSWGTATGLSPNSKVIGMAVTPDAGGYWVATANGGVFSYGDATFYGSLGGVKLDKPIVGITGTPDGHGYWLVASDGGVFSFGDAAFHGSTGGVKLDQPMVGITTTSDGAGYWLVASDGGVFSFGDAAFHGSTGRAKLDKPVVGIATTNDGMGYWLVASDGGVFNFGDATFFGSTGGAKLDAPVVGIAPTILNDGYWMVAADGGVFNFGNAGFFGSGGGNKLGSPTVGIGAFEPYLAG